MSDVSITITGIAPLLQKLGKVEGIRILDAPMQRSVIRIVDRMRQYPPARPGSKYIRGYGFEGGPRTSENLAKRWTTRVERFASEIRGKIGNNASYAALVQSAQDQARIHRGYWINTDQYVVNTEQRNIVRDFDGTIAQRLRG